MSLVTCIYCTELQACSILSSSQSALEVGNPELLPRDLSFNGFKVVDTRSFTTLTCVIILVIAFLNTITLSSKYLSNLPLKQFTGRSTTHAYPAEDPTGDWNGLEVLVSSPSAFKTPRAVDVGKSTYRYLIKTISKVKWRKIKR